MIINYLRGSMGKNKLIFRKPFVWGILDKPTSFKRLIFSRLFRWVEGMLMIIDGIIIVITLGLICSKISLDFFFWYTYKESFEWN